MVRPHFAQEGLEEGEREKEGLMFVLPTLSLFSPLLKAHEKRKLNRNPTNEKRKREFVCLFEEGDFEVGREGEKRQRGKEENGPG